MISGLPTTHLPDDVFVTSDHIYWSTRDLCLTRTCDAVPGTIQRADLDGTNIVTLVDGLIFPQDVVVTHHYVYWTDQYAGKIQRSSIDGTNVTDLVVGLNTPNGLSIVPLNIAIDIEPNWKNNINEIDLKKDKNLKVAALTGGDFDAVSQVDPTTVLFGPYDASPRSYRVKVADKDGDYDLIFIFSLKDTGIACGDIEATLIGETYGGTLIEGTDSFTVSPCS